jgi:hypothetical protein
VCFSVGADGLRRVSAFLEGENGHAEAFDPVVWRRGMRRGVAGPLSVETTLTPPSLHGSPHLSLPSEALARMQCNLERLRRFEPGRVSYRRCERFVARASMRSVRFVRYAPTTDAMNREAASSSARRNSCRSFTDRFASGYAGRNVVRFARGFAPNPRIASRRFASAARAISPAKLLPCGTRSPSEMRNGLRTRVPTR